MSQVTLPAVLQQGVTLLTTTAAIIAATGAFANTRVRINTCVFVNLTGAPTTITVTRTAAGGSAITLIPLATIQGNNSIVPKELVGMVLNPGDSISALASGASSINVFASGYSTTVS